MKQIYITAYDKYQKMNIKIELCSGRHDDDCWWVDSTSSREASGKIPVTITGDKEDPTISRWSDLEDIKLEVIEI